jgi:1-acyl-sn-glycerol-3-phosphate acyltransferase
MTAQTANIGALRSLLLTEIFTAFGAARDGWARQHLWPFFWLPAQTFSRFAAIFDQIVAEQGFDSAASWALPRFVKDILTAGSQDIPAEGPLLVVSNHPGTIDSLLITSQVHRKDFRIIASAIPFLMHLPNTAKHMIYAPRDTIDRMGVIRESVRHLQDGGSLLIFPSGHMDPDPAVHRGLPANFTEWSRSVELFLRKAPDTQLLISIVSNVLTGKYFHNPLTLLRRKMLERQKLAEFIQTMQQLVIPGSVNIRPRISFDNPFTLEKLHNRVDQSRQIMQAIAERASVAFARHMSSHFRSWRG